MAGPDLQPSTGDKVSLEEAKRATPTTPEPDEKALQEAKLLHEQVMQRTQLGLIGKLLGSAQEKSGNVAFLVILMCFIFMGIGFFQMPIADHADNLFKLFTVMLGPVALALGYLFGSGNSRRE